MNTTEGNEWKDDDGVALSPEMAIKYMEAKTIFLCKIPFFGAVGASTVNIISPNGQYANISFYGNEYWMKISEIQVVDTLVPMNGLQLPPDRPPVQRKPPVQEPPEAKKLREAYEKMKKKYPNG